MAGGFELRLGVERQIDALLLVGATREVAGCVDSEAISEIRHTRPGNPRRFSSPNGDENGFIIQSQVLQRDKVAQVAQ